MAGEHYREFIDEAFIQAMRSVLIVDDDYPTYDEILTLANVEASPEGPYAQKAWRRQRERVASLIAGFRRMRPPLLVDIHDGTQCLRRDRRNSGLPSSSVRSLGP